jgi:hypothetical protein
MLFSFTHWFALILVFQNHWISRNAFTGDLAPTFGSSWTSLTSFDIGFNEFSGVIPAAFGGSWTKLRTLRIGGPAVIQNNAVVFVGMAPCREVRVGGMDGVSCTRLSLYRRSEIDLQNCRSTKY